MEARKRRLSEKSAFEFDWWEELVWGALNDRPGEVNHLWVRAKDNLAGGYRRACSARGTSVRRTRPERAERGHQCAHCIAEAVDIGLVGGRLAREAVRSFPQGVEMIDGDSPWYQRQVVDWMAQSGFIWEHQPGVYVARKMLVQWLGDDVRKAAAIV